MTICRLLAVLIVGSSCLAANPSLREPELSDFAPVDPSVRIVVPASIWQVGEQYGSTRVVVYSHGWEHVRSIVAVQWLLHEESSQKVSVFKSAPISELNAGDWVNVDSVRFHDGVNGGEVAIAFTRRANPKPETMYIHLEAPGVYQVTRRSK